MPERILVRATNWVGDVVMSTPALAGIRRSYPNARISVLIKPPLNELLEGNPAVDEAILYDGKSYSGPAGMARIVRELRKRKFDRAILLQNAFKAALMAFLAKIPERMGYNTDGRGLLLTKGVKVADETRTKHQAHYYLDMLKALGLNADFEEPRLYLSKSESSDAARLLQEHGIGAGDIVVGINPGAHYGAAKRWHPERFGHVADGLVKEFGARILIFGGVEDAPAAGTVEASMKTGALNLAGRTTLRGIMALAARCSLFVTNDTGTMHVAAALGVPTLAVFGSTDPVATGPYGKGNRALRDPVHCSPCFKRTCPDGHYRCMERVSAARALKTAIEMMRDNVG